MENNIQTKVNKIGKAGRIVSVILIVCLSIGAFGLLIGGIVCAALPRDAVSVTIQPNVNVVVSKSLMGGEWANIDEAIQTANEKMDEEFKFSGVELEKADAGLLVKLQDVGIYRSFGMADALKAICAGFIAIASAMVTVVMFMQLSKAFEVCRSPFDEAVIKRMTIFAWTLIVCSVVGSFASGAASAAFSGFGNMNIDLSLNPIFIALMVFFLCMIFRYGATLQREADETL